MPLIVDPQLQASVIRQFNLRGELAPFNLTENVVPIFDIGTLLRAIDPTVVTTLAGSQGVRVGTSGTAALVTAQPPVVDTNVTDGGFAVNPGAAALLVDSGALGAGDRTFDIYLGGSALFDLIIEWRNAANAANVATWSILAGDVGGGGNVHWGPHNLDLANNERVRIVTGGAVVGTVASTIHHAFSQQSNAL